MTDPTPSPQDRLSITADDDGERRTFVLEGDLDPHTSPYLQGQIDEAIDAGGTVVLDVEGIAFADSAGLRVLADSHRRLTEAGGTFIVAKPSDRLQQLLRITGLADHLELEVP